VVNVPHVGATVAPISHEAVDEVFSIMEGLETVATRCAARRMTDADADALAEIVAAMDRALEHERYEAWADLNSQFHLAISRLSAMPLLQDMTERILSRWDRIRRYYFNGVLLHRIDQAQGEHRQILAAMRARDLAGLEAVVKDHNQGALQAYSEYLSRGLAP
jgi:DNA-binding GntR family transcriptional regulator